MYKIFELQNVHRLQNCPARKINAAQKFQLISTYISVYVVLKPQAP